MPAVESRPDAFTLPELAELTGYTRTALDYRVRRGLLRAKRDARGIWRVPASELPALTRRAKWSRTA